MSHIPSIVPHSICVVALQCDPLTAPASGNYPDPRLLTYTVTCLPFTLPLEPLGIPALRIEPCDSATSTVAARLVNPTESTFALTRVPAVVHADRPLELELAAVGLGAGACVAESIAGRISANALLTLTVEGPGKPREDVSVPVTVRPSGSGWIARALVRPASWANAASITVVSLSLDGLPLPCDYLPVTLRVGYNHAPSPAGVIVRAAKTGRVAALQAALDAGGSTAEADAVRYYVKGPRKGRTTQAGDSIVCETFPPFLPLTLLQYGDTASHWAATLGHLEALRTLLAAGADPAASTRVRKRRGETVGFEE